MSREARDLVPSLRRRRFFSTMGNRAFIAFGDRSTWSHPDCFLGLSLCFPCYFSCLVLVICCQYLVMDVIPLF
jgi:hypothetical protein